MQYINYIKGRLDGTGGRPACIKRQCGERAERAQLLLITALALAVILVTVALLLNAAIFTENVASRDTTADGHEAIELRGELVQGIGELIERENRQGQTESEIVNNVESGIDTTGPMVDRERAREGTIATLSHDPNEIETGELLRYNDNGDPKAFSDAGENNWTLVDDLGSARNFTVGIEPDTLNKSTAESSDEVFGVRFSNATEDDVTLHIYDDEDRTGNLTIARAVDGETPERLCQIEYDGTTTVDITGDRLSTDGAIVDCYRDLWPDYDPDAIEFVNIYEEKGTASVTVDDDDPVSDIEGTPVYSATVDITYQTTDLTFETTAKIAPGEP